MYWWNSFSLCISTSLNFFFLFSFIRSLIWWRTRYLVYVMFSVLYQFMAILFAFCVSMYVVFVCEIFFFIIFSTYMIKLIPAMQKKKTQNLPYKQAFTNTHTFARSFVRSFGLSTLFALWLQYQCVEWSIQSNDRPAFPKHLNRCVRAYEQLWEI